LTCAVGGLQPVEERVRRVGADDARIEGLFELAIDYRARDRNFRRRFLVLDAAAGGDAQLRPIAGKRLRHVLVGGTQRRALRIERRIVLIRLHQGPLERIRRRLPAADPCSGHRNAGNGPKVRPHPAHETYATPAYPVQATVTDKKFARGQHYAPQEPGETLQTGVNYRIPEV